MPVCSGGAGIRTLMPVRAPVFKTGLGIPPKSPGVRNRPVGMQLRDRRFDVSPRKSPYVPLSGTHFGAHPEKGSASVHPYRRFAVSASSSPSRSGGIGPNNRFRAMHANDLR